MYTKNTAAFTQTFFVLSKEVGFVDLDSTLKHIGIALLQLPHTSTLFSQKKKKILLIFFR